MGVKCAESLEYRLLNILVLLCQSSSEAEVFGINLVFVDAVQHLVPSHVKPRIIVSFLCSFEALACTICTYFVVNSLPQKKQRKYFIVALEPFLQVLWISS